MLLARCQIIPVTQEYSYNFQVLLLPVYSKYSKFAFKSVYLILLFKNRIGIGYPQRTMSSKNGWTTTLVMVMNMLMIVNKDTNFVKFIRKQDTSLPIVKVVVSGPYSLLTHGQVFSCSQLYFLYQGLLAKVLHIKIWRDWYHFSNSSSYYKS